MFALKSIAAWLFMLCLAAANGVFREVVLIRTLGKASGLLLSGLLLAVFIAAVAYAFVRWQREVSVSQGFKVGVLWLCLTLTFEFGTGRYVQNKAWSELLEAYAFKEGNVWPVVLLVTLLAPCLAAKHGAQRRHADALDHHTRRGTE